MTIVGGLAQLPIGAIGGGLFGRSIRSLDRLGADRQKTVARRSLAWIVTTLAIASLTGCAPASLSESGEPAIETGKVTAVVDGDTIDVDTAHGRVRVRLIGIDTPEIGRHGTAGECYAEEARDFLDHLIYGKTVELVADTTQADTDVYGRSLRYVLVDGRSAALSAITAGVGYEYTYDVAYIDQHAHRGAQDAAAASGAGLWAACPH